MISFMLLPLLVVHVMSAVTTEPVAGNNTGVAVADNATREEDQQDKVEHLDIVPEVACDRTKTPITKCKLDVTGSEVVTFSQDTNMVDVVIHCDTTAENCIIVNEGITLSIFSATITGTSQGRFIKMEKDSTLEIYEVTASGFGTTSIEGGFIYCPNTNGKYKVTINHSEIKNNKATYGGAISLRGAGEFKAQSTVFESNTAENTANSAGGAIYGWGVSTDITLALWDIQGCTFKRNTGTQGGAIYAYHITATIATTVITANTAKNHGGGIFSSKSSFTLQCSLLASNTATTYTGGAVYSQVNTHITLIKTVFLENKDVNGNNDIKSDGAHNKISIDRDMYITALNASGGSTYAYITPEQNVEC